MTEADWLAGVDSGPMLAFVREHAGERKLRLFAAACARLVWDRLPPGVLREAVEATERCADGVPRGDELSGYCHRLYELISNIARGAGQDWLGGEHAVALGLHFLALITTISEGGLRAAGFGSKAPWVLPLVGPQLPSLLREVFGNPFRPAAAGRTAAVAGLASAIHAERAFDRMPGLADALEVAGCDDADLLAHCRSGGPHVRGCWAVDTARGKGA